MFDNLDGRFGGGHARESLIKYLSVDADRLLRGRYSAEVGRELFSAVGEATLLGAWMTCDSAPTSFLAQSYFVQAPALAQSGSDRLLGASILDAMSHQATDRLFIVSAGGRADGDVAAFAVPADARLQVYSGTPD